VGSNPASATSNKDVKQEEIRSNFSKWCRSGSLRQQELTKVN
jgi:hypothetical protein